MAHKIKIVTLLIKCQVLAVKLRESNLCWMNRIIFQTLHVIHRQILE